MGGLGPDAAKGSPPFEQQPSPYGQPGPAVQQPPKQKGVWGKKKTFGFFAALMLGAIAMFGVGIVVVTAAELSETAKNVAPSADIGSCFRRNETQQAVSCDTRHHFVVFAIVSY